MWCARQRGLWAAAAGGARLRPPRLHRGPAGRQPRPVRRLAQRRRGHRGPGEPVVLQRAPWHVRAQSCWDTTCAIAWLYRRCIKNGSRPGSPPMQAPPALPSSDQGLPCVCVWRKAHLDRETSRARGSTPPSRAGCPRRWTAARVRARRQSRLRSPAAPPSPAHRECALPSRAQARARPPWLSHPAVMRR